MRVSPAGAILLLAVAGCSAQSPGAPCEGLVYTDAGLTREQYAPCARAMVATLDDLWRAVEIIFVTQNLIRIDRAERDPGGLDVARWVTEGLVVVRDEHVSQNASPRRAS